MAGRWISFFVIVIIFKKGFYGFQVVDQKNHYQYSDGDPTPFFQHVNMNVLVDKVDDIVAEKGINQNRGQSTAEHDQKIIDRPVVQQVADDGPYHRPCHEKGEHDKQK